MELNKTKYYLKVVSSSLVIQIFLQFLGIVVGFIIVRKLNIREYAYYTIANTILIMLTMISDSGLNAGVYAISAQNWTDKSRVSSIISTGLYYRSKFAIVAFLISIPFLAHLLLKQGSDWFNILLILLTIIPSFRASLSEAFLTVIPSLDHNYSFTQKNQLLVAILRLIFTSIVLLFFPIAPIILLISGITRIIGNFQLKKYRRSEFTLRNEKNPIYAKDILKLVYRSAPGTIYMAFSGQISLWILSLMGKTANIAQYGALNRFAVVFTGFFSMITVVFSPKFARSENIRKKLLIKSHQVLILSFFIASIILFVFYNYSNFFLSLLGKNYNGLNNELFLVVLTSYFCLFRDILFDFTLKKGWIPPFYVDLFINILPLVFWAIVLPLNNLHNILFYGFCMGVSYFILRYILFLYQLFKFTRL